MTLDSLIIICSVLLILSITIKSILLIGIMLLVVMLNVVIECRIARACAIKLFTNAIISVL